MRDRNRLLLPLLWAELLRQRFDTGWRLGWQVCSQKNLGDQFWLPDGLKVIGTFHAVDEVRKRPIHQLMESCRCTQTMELCVVLDVLGALWRHLQEEAFVASVAHQLAALSCALGRRH